MRSLSNRPKRNPTRSRETKPTPQVCKRCIASADVLKTGNEWRQGIGISRVYSG